MLETIVQLCVVLDVTQMSYQSSDRVYRAKNVQQGSLPSLPSSDGKRSNLQSLPSTSEYYIKKLVTTGLTRSTNEI